LECDRTPDSVSATFRRPIYHLTFARDRVILC